MRVERPDGHRLAEHLLQAERLAAELERSVATGDPPDLVFHGQGPVRVHLDEIRLAGEAELVRPERQCP